jgi:hypothetical protein
MEMERLSWSWEDWMRGGLGREMMERER